MQRKILILITFFGLFSLKQVAMATSYSLKIKGCEFHFTLDTPQGFIASDEVFQVYAEDRFEDLAHKAAMIKDYMQEIERSEAENIEEDPLVLTNIRKITDLLLITLSQEELKTAASKVFERSFLSSVTPLPMIGSKKTWKAIAKSLAQNQKSI